MALDNNLVLHDGTEITDDISPTSTTRTSGSAVIDLKGTAEKGMVAIMFVAEDLFETSDTLVVSIEGCATVDGTYEELARFATLTYGDDTVDTYFRYFSTKFRYIRAKINVTDDDGESDFSVSNLWIILAPSGHTL